LSDRPKKKRNDAAPGAYAIVIVVGGAALVAYLAGKPVVAYALLVVVGLVAFAVLQYSKRMRAYLDALEAGATASEKELEAAAAEFVAAARATDTDESLREQFREAWARAKELPGPADRLLSRYEAADAQYIAYLGEVKTPRTAAEEKREVVAAYAKHRDALAELRANPDRFSELEQINGELVSSLNI
jgi:hypothetical protein